MQEQQLLLLPAMFVVGGQLLEKFTGVRPSVWATAVCVADVINKTQTFLFCKCKYILECYSLLYFVMVLERVMKISG